MTDFLTRLAERSVGAGEVARPRVAPLFEPRARIVEEVRELEAEPPPRPRAPVTEAAAAPEPRAEPVAALPETQPVVDASLTEPRVQEEERVEVVREVVVERVASTESALPIAPAREPSAADQESVPIETSEHARPRPESERAPRPARAIERRPPARPLVRAAEPLPPPEPHESWLEPPPPAPERSLAPLTATPVEPLVVRVTIGRVDVRAVLPPPPAARKPPKRAPGLTLDEYLREGRRS